MTNETRWMWAEIEALQKKRGETDEQFAVALGSCSRSVSNWRKGARPKRAIRDKLDELQHDDDPNFNSGVHEQ